MEDQEWEKLSADEKADHLRNELREFGLHVNGIALRLNALLEGFRKLRESLSQDLDEGHSRKEE